MVRRVRGVTNGVSPVRGEWAPLCGVASAFQCKSPPYLSGENVGEDLTSSVIWGSQHQWDQYQQYLQYYCHIVTNNTVNTNLWSIGVIRSSSGHHRMSLGNWPSSLSWAVGSSVITCHHHQPTVNTGHYWSLSFRLARVTGMGIIGNE